MRAKSLILLLVVVLGLLGAAPCPALTVTHGPVVGGVTATSARVFVRTDADETASIWLTPPSGPAIVVPFTTTAATDFTAIVTATGLAPSTHYAVTVPGTDVAGEFTSFPVPQSTDPVTIVYLTDFQGPTGVPKEPTPVFANAAAELPNFVMLGGDMDHSNPGTGFAKATDPAIVTESYRAMWRGMYSFAPVAGLPSFAPNILARFPVAHMLDDHDWGLNNADKNFRWGDVAVQVFSEYMPTYPLEAPAGSRGLWQHFSYAYVDVFVVDTRTQRSPEGAADNGNKSMLDGNRLGLAGQEQWLENGLAGSTKTWKVILMPTPFNPTVIKRSGTPIWQQDSWTGYLTARAKLLHSLAVHGVKNVLMLSGDLHAGAIDDGTNSGVIEMVTPAPNFTGTSPEKCLTADDFGIWSHGTYSKKKPPRVCNGYGVVRLTPTQATLQVKDEDGKVKLQLIVPAR